MNPVTAMLYPIMLLLPAADVVENERSAEETVQALSIGQDDAADGWQEQAWFEHDVEAPLHAGIFGAVTAFQAVEPESSWQVRIEQRMTIRINPRASRSTWPDMFVGLPEGETASRFSERKIGKCIPVASIAGVQPARDNRLLLFLHDRRIISAELERSCRSGAFYSGFLLSRSPDGQLCADRDTLLSRSGSNCRLTRIRQLVEDDD